MEVRLLEARGLVDVDVGEPYVVLRLGKQQFTSKSKRNTLNPFWNETFKVCG